MQTLTSCINFALTATDGEQCPDTTTDNHFVSEQAFEAKNSDSGSGSRGSNPRSPAIILDIEEGPGIASGALIFCSTIEGRNLLAPTCNKALAYIDSGHGQGSDRDSSHRGRASDLGTMDAGNADRAAAGKTNKHRLMEILHSVENIRG